jgi:hypothetical protein
MTWRMPLPFISGGIRIEYEIEYEYESLGLDG